MQPSTELKNLILQLYEKLTAGGVLEFAKHLYSRQNGMFVIGSDPNEWFEDYESIIRFYEAESAADLEIKVDDLRAYCKGDVGWAADRVTVKLPNGVEVPVRHTYIFHEEDGVWKIVHAHISVGVPDETFQS